MCFSTVVCHSFAARYVYYINVRENRKGNQERTNRKNWKHWAQDTERRQEKQKHNAAN